MDESIEKFINLVEYKQDKQDKFEIDSSELGLRKYRPIHVGNMSQQYNC